jgi:hypothetical protein
VRQVGATKANASEPLMTCRKPINDIKTEVCSMPREQPGGNLLTAQAVSGIQVARAWLGLWCGTWEPVALTKMAGLGVPAQPSGTIGCGLLPASSSKGDPQAVEQQEVEYRCRAQGRTAPYERRRLVTQAEQRGRDVRDSRVGQPPCVGGAYTAVRSRARL